MKTDKQKLKYIKYKQICLELVTYPVEQASTAMYKNKQCDAKAVNPLRFVYCSRVSNVASQSGFLRWLFGSSYKLTRYTDTYNKHTNQIVNGSYSSKVMPGVCFTFRNAQCFKSGKCWTIIRSAAARRE